MQILSGLRHQMLGVSCWFSTRMWRVLAAQSRNVIELVNCYETRNHLWVIFEYCAGGDLLRLLKQDGRLPEERAPRRQFVDVFGRGTHLRSPDLRGLVARALPQLD